MITSPLQYLTFALFLSTSALNGAELLAYYEFNDDYTDSSGKGNTAEESQNPDELSFAVGFRGKSLDINDPSGGATSNTGGSIDIPIDANAESLPGVTFGGWLNVDEATVGEFDGFMSTDNGGWDRGISVNANTSGSFGIASGAGPVDIGEITAGQWQYVVASFDFDATIAQLYVGGADPDNQTTESDFTDDLAQLGEPVIELGRYDNQDLDALVDDIFVFDSALDAYQINAIRNLRLSNADLSPLQVAALFTLFEDSEEGMINGANWKPVSGLSTVNPGALIDQGEAGVAVVLASDGNGMLGDPSAFVEKAKDSDNDEMDDAWELVFFKNLERDGTGDFDEDGVLDLDEFKLGLFPDNKDSDSDALEDGAEIANSTNPLVKDTDGDGLEDGPEVATHMTDPTKADTDGDSFSDGVEIASQTDPLDPDDKPVPAGFSLLGYYEFEDSYFDSSQNGNAAVPGQNPDEISFIDGFRGKSLNINDPDGGANTGGSVNIPINANASELPDVSFGGWINVDPDNVEFDGFMAVDNGGWDRGISVNANASSSFGIASGAAPSDMGEITPGEWQYVMGTFSNENERAILYVGSDNADDQTTETTEVPDLAIEGEPVIEVGRYDNQDLDGIVDDIFVFGSELDAHQANAIRNLRLSALDLSPRDAAQIFDLFVAGDSGSAGGINWTQTSGLEADPPGAVVESGGGVTVVLDDAGNGMVTGSAPRFEITSFVINTEGDTRSVTLTWSSRDRKIYALEAAPDLDQWLEVDDGIDSGGDETTYTDMSAEIATDSVRYYRVREVR
jgi:hypothetical protein